MAHRFNPDKADRLIAPERAELLPPDKVLAELGIRVGDSVADLGAGNGFLTLPITRATTGIVYAVDIEEKMLQLLEQRAKQEQLSNIHYVTSDLEEIKLPDQSVDKIVVAFVLHEVRQLNQALKEIKRILKPGGKGLVLEWDTKEMEMGPPLHERISVKDLQHAFHQEGYIVRVFYPNNLQYGLIVQPSTHSI